MKTLAIIISFFFILISCDDVDSRFCVVNKTDKNVCVYLTKDSSTNNAKLYFSEYGKVDKQLRQYYFIKPTSLLWTIGTLPRIIGLMMIE